MEEKNGFDITKLIVQKILWHCGAAVKELLERADNPGSTPGDAVLYFLNRFCFSV